MALLTISLYEGCSLSRDFVAKFSGESIGNFLVTIIRPGLRYETRI